MSKLFMHGTSLKGIEQLMVMVPNFQPRRSGIVINNYFNWEGGVKDCNCNLININNGWNECGYIGSDLKINVDRCRYKDIVRECFGKINNYYVQERLKSLVSKFKGEIFLNHNHKERFYNFLQKKSLDTNDISLGYITILFLLTADESLWKSSEDIVSQGKIDLKQICLKEIDTEAYALYQTAKTISTGKECIKINELADGELIDDMTFKAIINSALINRYGAEIFLITK
ncbi:hypothetical protein [Tissierella sp.]|uniref:hypothetical protein n=1 Tax=Tissierella sp. TaxID=41274 RepID=UPI0028ACD572|nr:hypothetical protein [Tissierella sp.]